MSNKPIPIKIFEKFIKKDSKVTSKNIGKLFNLNKKKGLQILDILKLNNILIQKYETNKGKCRFNTYTIHNNIINLNEKEIELLKNMLCYEYTIIDNKFKEDYKNKLNKYDDKYNDGRFYRRKAKRLGYYSEIILLDVLKTVIFKSIPNITTNEFKEFKKDYIEKTNKKTKFNSEINFNQLIINNELSNYCCYDKNIIFNIKTNEEKNEFRNDILKYCIFPIVSIAKDNGYSNSFSEIANETLKFLIKLQRKNLKLKLKKELFYKLTFYKIFKIIPINVRNGRRKIFIYILSLINKSKRIAKYFYILECKKINKKISKKILNNENNLMEIINNIYNDKNKIWEILNKEEDINYIFKKITLKEIINIKVRNTIISSLKSFISIKILKRTQEILEILEIPFLIKNENEIKINLIIKTNLKKYLNKINENQRNKISKEFKSLYIITLPISERLEFYNKLDLTNINTFMTSFNQTIYNIKGYNIDKQHYWYLRLRSLKSHSKYEIPSLETIKLTKIEENKLYKLKKKILKYKKMPNLLNNTINTKLIKKLKEKRIIINEKEINLDFLKMKYENLKNLTSIPIKKINSNIFIENIYYLLMKKGSMDIKNISKELEFFSYFDVLKVIKKSNLFKINNNNYGISISIK